MTFVPTTFSYQPNIPNRPNYPGNDQPQMTQNNVSLGSCIGIDHFSPNAQNAGWHQKVTFGSNYTILDAGGMPDPTVLPTGQISLLFTQLGAAIPTVPVLVWRNSQSSFIVDCVQAYGIFQAATGSPTPVTQTLLNQFNVASATFDGTIAGKNQFTILLNSNLFSTGVQPGVFLTSSKGDVMTYTFSGSSLVIVGPTAGAFVSFMLLQV